LNSARAGNDNSPKLSRSARLVASPRGADSLTAALRMKKALVAPRGVRYRVGLFDLIVPRTPRGWSAGLGAAAGDIESLFLVVPFVIRGVLGWVEAVAARIQSRKCRLPPI